MNGQDSRMIENKMYLHRMFEEFCEITRIIKESDYSKAKHMLEQSQIVLEIVEEAMNSAGIKNEIGPFSKSWGFVNSFVFNYINTSNIKINPNPITTVMEERTL